MASFYEAIWEQLRPRERGDQPIDSGGDRGADLYLIVDLANELFALPAGSIDEVTRLPELTPVPRVKPLVLGIFEHRGVLVPIVRLSELVSIASPMSPEEPLVVVVGEGSDLLGLQVDRVEGIQEIPSEECRELPNEDWNFVSAAARIEGRLCGLLSVGEILSLPEDSFLDLEPTGHE